MTELAGNGERIFQVNTIYAIFATTCRLYDSTKGAHSPPCVFHLLRNPVCADAYSCFLLPDPCTLVSARPAPPKTNISRQTEKHVSNQDMNRLQPELQKALPPMLSHLPRTIRSFMLLAAFSRCLSLVAAAADGAAETQIDFDREIQPLLSETCFTCHGPDAEKLQAGLRLDRKESAFGPLQSGNKALVPGSPEQSELIRRLLSTDPDEVMPPPSEQKRLSAAQIELMQKWVRQGAVWKRHWSFEPIESPPVPEAAPTVSGEGNPIDAFVRARLAQDGLELSPEESRERLIRRRRLSGPHRPAAFDQRCGCLCK